MQAAERLDGGSQRFRQDSWTRPPGAASTQGQGITAVLQGGDVLEKAAVNTTIVCGVLSPQRAQAMSARGRGINAAGGQPYEAAALSLVFHSQHPFIPTLRADVRRFSVRCCCCRITCKQVSESLRVQVEGQTWYGGGCDLTPGKLQQQFAAPA